MFTIFYEHKLLAILTFTFLIMSILCQIIAGVIYQSMITEADNMSSTNNKLLKQCKQKYANYYKLNGKMVNTSAFVDKFLQKICIMRIPLQKFSHLAGQLMMLSVLVTGISICLSLASGDTLFQIIPHYLVSILGLYLYFSVSGLMDLQEKKSALKINLVDYLENHFLPRLEIEKEVSFEEGIKKRELRTQELLKEQEEMQEDHAAVTGYQDELERLLEEFFA